MFLPSDATSLKHTVHCRARKFRRMVTRYMHILCKSALSRIVKPRSLASTSLVQLMMKLAGG